MNPADILQWLRLLQSTPGMTLAARAVGMALALRMNARTGEAFPSKAQIAEDVGGMNVSTAHRAVAALVAAGLLRVQFSNGRRSNRYRLTQPKPNPVASNPVARNGDNPPTSEEVESMPTPQFGGGVENISAPPPESPDPPEPEPEPVSADSTLAPVQPLGIYGCTGTAPTTAPEPIQPLHQCNRWDSTVAPVQPQPLHQCNPKEQKKEQRKKREEYGPAFACPSVACPNPGKLGTGSRRPGMDRELRRDGQGG